MGSANRAALFGEAGASNDSCEAEIENFDIVVAANDNVLWLQVAVNDTFSVNIFEGIEEREEPGDAALCVDGGVSFDDVVEGFSLNVFEDEDEGALILSKFDELG